MVKTIYFAVDGDCLEPDAVQPQCDKYIGPDDYPIFFQHQFSKYSHLIIIYPIPYCTITHIEMESCK